MSTKRTPLLLTILALGCLGLLSSRQSKDKKPGSEEGAFKILVAGKEIGSEKYSLQVGENSVSTTSVMEFTNPADGKQKVHLETRLETDLSYRPTSYQLTSEVGHKKGSILGQFSQDTAMFEYRQDGAPKKSGVMVGPRFTLLDTNIFHHYIFLARFFNLDSGEATQRFEVVIPQEGESGFLKVRQLGTEEIQLGSRKIDTHKFEADSGSLQITLWIDDSRILHKIAVPGLGIEVLRTR